MEKPKVCILGGGLAGLTAGLTLLRQSRGGLDVTILERGHLLGGKASSIAHRDGDESFEVEHGAHLVFDYPNLRRVMGWEHGDPPSALEPSDGAWFAQPDGTSIEVAPVSLPSPLHLAPGLKLRSMMVGSEVGFARATLAGICLRPERLTPRERRHLDQMYFSAAKVHGTDERGFLSSLGVSDSILGGELARAAPRSTFAGAFASAGSMLLAMRLVQQDHRAQRVSFLKGPIQRVLIEPLARAFCEAGGTVSPRPTPVYEIGYDATRGRVDHVVVEAAVKSPHGREAGDPRVSRYHSTVKWPASVQQPVVHRADHFISALPVEALRKLVRPTALGRLPLFARLEEMESQTTLACQIYYDRKVTPERFRMMVGVDGMWSVVLDRARIWSKPDHAPGTEGSILVMVGEGEGHAFTPEEMVPELIASARLTAARLFPEVAKANERRIVVHRTGHDHYFKTNRGSERLRPSSDTPVENLVLAGDWVGHSFGAVNMEGAVVSGLEAANHVLRRTGYAHALAPVIPMREPGGFIPALRALLRVTGTMRPLLGYTEVL